jgi:pimeloyl-ACP methyl ester carboxylesterase
MNSQYKREGIVHKLCVISARYALCVLIAMLLFISGVAQQPNRTDAPKPPGRLVDAGGHRLHINCKGTGSPTVVMESGAGDFSFDWDLVHGVAAKNICVCTYDRAGYAWSEPGPTPRTMQQIAAELHTGLLNAKLKGPYVLVGQSLGGLIVRTYASQYPKEVAGIVLVDSSHEDMLISLTDRTTKQENIVRFRELSRGREIPSIQSTIAGPSSKSPQAQPASSAESKLDAPYDKLAPSLQQVRLWAMSQPTYSVARSSEFDFLPEEMARMYSDRSKSKYPLGDIPLIVLTRGTGQTPVGENSTNKLRESHDRLQADLATLSTNSKQIIARKAGHHIQLDDPELVADAIAQMVDAIRQSTRRTR